MSTASAGLADVQELGWRPETPRQRSALISRARTCLKVPRHRRRSRHSVVTSPRAVKALTGVSSQLVRGSGEDVTSEYAGCSSIILGFGARLAVAGSSSAGVDDVAGSCPSRKQDQHCPCDRRHPLSSVVIPRALAARAAPDLPDSERCRRSASRARRRPASRRPPGCADRRRAARSLRRRVRSSAGWSARPRIERGHVGGIGRVSSARTRRTVGTSGREAPPRRRVVDRPGGGTSAATARAAPPLPRTLPDGPTSQEPPDGAHSRYSPGGAAPGRCIALR